VVGSTLAYLMRWPVWVDLVEANFSVSEVAGYSATGQVTSEKAQKAFHWHGEHGILRKRNRSTNQDNTGEPDSSAQSGRLDEWR